MNDLKAVVFRLGAEEYGVDIQQVVSIERLQPLTTIPKTQPHVKGVMELRQKVIPIVDLRIFMEKEDHISDESRILVVDTQDQAMGLIVDEAKDVIDVTTSEIQTFTMQGSTTNSIQGVANDSDRMIILLDLQTLLIEIDPVHTLQEIIHEVETDRNT